MDRAETVAVETILAVGGGDDILFRDETITGIVNYQPTMPARRDPKKSLLNYRSDDLTTIEILASAITEAPKQGEYFTDANTYQHEIKTVKRVGACWVCWCELSK